MQGFTEEVKKQILEIARETITKATKGESYELPSFDNDIFYKKTAIFVTLTKNGMLRGCIGTTEPVYELGKAVKELAISAAMRDPRFPPVRESELKDIKIEISILSDLQKIDDHNQIIPNEHGVVVEKGFNKGLFLPQVWEHFNSKEDFMNELCMQKAGLRPESWKNGTIDLYVFNVLKFSEN